MEGGKKKTTGHTDPGGTEGAKEESYWARACRRYLAVGGNVVQHRATKRLHLIVNPKRPDIFMGRSEAEADVAATLDLLDAYVATPPYAQAPRA